ncbi:hypothetical protein K431DRAFT_286500 [Polychaeton citri CBS 116435]|uniref:Uncharacterized protein n=1 Tax=Polychaeton citri CBS 116435 TaxID=1314669 RepID=A0A9P4Q344_9PEZI|nr:hypothetical protein K431DRAFT_286500 [Polychaeton citri CBS 116435]
MSLKENAPAPRHSSEPPQAQLSQTQHTSVMPSLALPTANDFAFRSEHQMPSNHDRQDAGMELDSVTSTGPPSATSSTDNGSAAIRIVPRHRRDKHNNRRRDNQQQPALNFNLGSGAGNKRKMPYPDFFDISGVSSEGPDWKKDGSNSGGNNGMRGGKRGRHV